jgi:hypothetical protein
MKHWTLYVLDIPNRTILFGDSLGGEAHQDDLETLDFFLGHAICKSDQLPFKLVKLSMNAQDNAYSCAVTVWDAITQFLFNAPPWTAKEKHFRHIEWALYICLRLGMITPEDLELSEAIVRDMMAQPQEVLIEDHMETSSKSTTDIINAYTDMYTVGVASSSIRYTMPPSSEASEVHMQSDIPPEAEESHQSSTFNIADQQLSTSRLTTAGTGILPWFSKATSEEQIKADRKRAAAVAKKGYEEDKSTSIAGQRVLTVAQHERKKNKDKLRMRKNQAEEKAKIESQRPKPVS